MSKALYRKYRSRSLAEVVGQSHVTDILSGAFSRDNVSHAYLLTGPRGVGKTSVARIIAHEINKLPYSDDPNLDIIEIDAASNRRIDDIRDLREKVHIAPVSAAYKVYIIDEVHMLTGESFNALLKTLEEPPAHVVFILATTELHKVPATIISRTQRFHFRPVEQSIVSAHLRTIADKENIAIDDEALSLIATHGSGSFRDSISLLDQMAHTGENVTVHAVEHALGLLPATQVTALVETVVKRKLSDLLTLITQATTAGMSHVTLADQLIVALGGVAPSKPELYPLINQLLEVKKSHAPEIKLLAILATYAKPSTHQSLTASAPIAAQKHIMQLKKEKKESIERAVQTPEPVKKPAEPIKTSVTRTNRVFNWDAVIAALQSYNPSLYSVLKRAGHSYNGTTLTLDFDYVIHRKKLENAKYRAELVKIITDICGECPEFVLRDKKSAPLPSEAAVVADIMGGGDSVNASV